ncbi:NAD(P)H:quinone oxidoreductase, type IV [Meridianimarinicoccus roseus]|uniref:NAD(P)H:quinone oxidoreductase, type IV n=1 Tax=Meridianimarinicoccus roseus TaxID=2072018 RepID=A0A2V2LEA3_9RHOB|nr:NAD(P)H:quinone oxidoreductase [Meridianimarinicoccus roseus]PWR03898.1 NAD(P)H:quinone oxidoreductase, type IV [Meridianimarinicoccus roseus]
MTAPKITIAYYSTYGTNHAVAEAAAEAARAAGAEIRLRRIPETAPQSVIDTQDAWKAQVEKTAHIPEATADDMAWADGYFFIAPTRFGNMPSQVRAFIDTLGGLWFQGKLANKTVTAATSANNAHAGQESTLLGLYTTFMHWGAYIITPGFTDEAVAKAGGNPYGFSTTAGAFDDAGRAAVAHQARRLVEVTAKLVTSDATREAA